MVGKRPREVYWSERTGNGCIRKKVKCMDRVRKYMYEEGAIVEKPDKMYCVVSGGGS